MPFVTVQIGQCGNQLGASWFNTLSEELSSGGYAPHAAEAYFEHQHDSATAPSASKQWAARAVLVDMEPKVIYSAQAAAAQSTAGWCYARRSAISGQSGSGNNWAMGHHRFGPALAPDVLELVRRQVEACDCCEGFLMLQSMAGGTGAGVGAALAEALTDEFSSAHMLNCCVWPFASGEVTVQPYNSMLSMAALTEASSGILLLQNEQLAATCSRLMGIKNPGFKELNAVASRALAGALLPCYRRPAAAAPPPPAASSNRPRSGSSRPGSATSSIGSSKIPAKALPQPQQQQQQLVDAGTAPGMAVPLHSLSDVVCHLYSHPSFRLASLRHVPQLPARSVDFTSFSWPALLGRLKAMQMAGLFLEEGLSSFMAAGAASLPPHKYKNRSASSLLVLRGSEAGSVGAREFQDPGLFSSWPVDPLLVAASRPRFGGCQMSATLLATDQACVAPLRPMLDKAYTMLAARAYVHQYEAHGLAAADFTASLAAVEDVLASYAAL